MAEVRKGKQDGNEIYRLMVERTLDAAIFMLDADGRVITWNAGAERIKGYTPAQVLGRHFSIFYPRDDVRAGKPERELLAAASKGRLEEEGWRVRSGGARLWAYVIITPIRDEKGELLGFVYFARDLTEQKRMEAELRRSHERFHNAIELAPSAMMMLNRAGRIEMMNLQAEVIFGYPRDELLGQPVEMLIPARFRKNHPKHRISFFANPATRPMGVGLEVCALRKDGREFPVEIGLSPVETDDGSMVLASITDITDRKRKEEELRRSRERFRQVVEGAPNAILLVAADGRIEMVNYEAERLFDYSREELLGRPIDILVPEHLREKQRKSCAAFLADPQVKPFGTGREIYGLKKDGTEFPVEIALNPIDDDGGLKVLVEVADITDRKRKEDEIAKSRERFRQVVEHAPEAMVLVCEHGRIDMVNLEAEAIFGYRRGELLGEPIETLVPERHHARLAKFRQAFFADPKPRRMGSAPDLHGTGLRKDGSEFPLEIALNPIEIEGRPMVLVSIADITDRKKKEELIAATLKEKEVLLSEIHHRVKNNLQIVKSMLHLSAARIDDPVLRAVLSDCDSRITSMALIHETLCQSADFARVDFASFLAALSSAVKGSIGFDQVRISLSFAASEVLLPIDVAITCGQIANELLTNAMRHAFPDGRKGHISVTLTREGKGVITLSVTDDGVGIAEDAEAGSSKTLGLRIVRLLTDQLRGTLSINRANPTRFTVAFPLPDESEAKSGGDDAAPKRKGRAGGHRGIL